MNCPARDLAGRYFNVLRAALASRGTADFYIVFRDQKLRRIWFRKWDGKELAIEDASADVRRPWARIRRAWWFFFPGYIFSPPRPEDPAEDYLIWK